MKDFALTSKTLEAKVGKYFYKIVLDFVGMEGVRAIIFRTLLENPTTGFGSYGQVPAVQTIDANGNWANLLITDTRKFPSLEAVLQFVEY